MRLLYLVHDLSDPAVARRVAMLVSGGAEVVLAGFHRDPTPPAAVCGLTPVALGRTHDAQLARRAVSVGVQRMNVSALARRLGPADIILARNLEMLALAAPLARATGAARLVYEVLDIHRHLTRDGAVGRALIMLEARLGQTVDLVLVSSPAFVTQYFDPRSGITAPVHLVENKVLREGPATPVARPPHAPWRIGLLGALRCRRSVELLRGLAAACGCSVEVIIRGRPSPAVFPDIERLVAEDTNVQFHGPYAPDDLAKVYGELHFVFAMDFYEEGANSEWLLPNRLYEGLYHGTVPIALQRTQTGRTLHEMGAGILIGDDIARGLLQVFEAMTPERYAQEAARVSAIPTHRLAASSDDCRALVQTLAGTIDMQERKAA